MIDADTLVADIADLQGELEQAVDRIAKAVQALDNSTITERVIVLLIQDAAGQPAKSGYKKLSAKVIRQVLEAIRDLPSHCFEQEEDE